MNQNPAECILSGKPKALRTEQRVFLLMTVMLSWSVMIPIWMGLPPEFRPGDGEAVEKAFGSWVMLFGAGPMLAALLVTAWYRRKVGVTELFSRVVRWRVAPQWFLIALTLPLVSQWMGLWFWGQITGNPVSYPPLMSHLSSWLQIAAISSLYFITEELGWRGFLLPRVLAQTHWLKAALVVGVIWAVWHYPYWLTASWTMTGSWSDASFGALVSTGRAIALSVMLTWIFRNTKGSVLLAMLFHGSNNANFDKMFAAGGEPAMQGSIFLVVQSAASIAVAVVLVVLTTYRNRKPAKG